MNEIMFSITDENEENMKLLVRAMRKADWMLSTVTGRPPSTGKRKEIDKEPRT